MLDGLKHRMSRAAGKRRNLSVPQSIEDHQAKVAATLADITADHSVEEVREAAKRIRADIDAEVSQSKTEAEARMRAAIEALEDNGITVRRATLSLLIAALGAGAREALVRSTGYSVRGHIKKRLLRRKKGIPIPIGKPTDVPIEGDADEGSDIPVETPTEVPIEGGDEGSDDIPVETGGEPSLDDLFDEWDRDNSSDSWLPFR